MTLRRLHYGTSNYLCWTGRAPRPWRLAALLLLLIAAAPCRARASEPRPAPAAAAPQAPADREGAVGLMREGAVLFNRGAFEEAAARYEAASALYQREADQSGTCDALVALSRTRYFSGRYGKGREELEAALAIARQLDDSRRTAAILGYLGDVRIATGELEEAGALLERALALARTSQYREVAASVLNNLGNLKMAQHQPEEAFPRYRAGVQEAEQAGDGALAALASVNAALAAGKAGKYQDARREAEQSRARLLILEESYLKGHTLVNLALLCRELAAELAAERGELIRESCALLTQALAVAERTGDRRTQSYAFGHLGRIYEEQGRLAEALELTRRGAFAAQLSQLPEALYLWHWQSGRILARQGQTDQAIVSYRLCLQYLKGIREEMGSCYANPDSSYHKTASTVCAELVDLLLTRAAALGPGESDQAYLAEARDALEALRAYELREYFKDDCLDAGRAEGKRLDTVSGKAAVIYPILLKDRTELLVSFSGRLKRHTLAVGAALLTQESRALRDTLEKRTTWEFLPHSRKLYDWLVRPFEKELKESGVETLVFVPDGPLRNIPMAALNDGSEFLVQRYAIAVTPGLDLVDPRPLNRGGEAKLLALGLTQAVQGFAALPYVSDELSAVKGLYGGNVLLNEEFRMGNVERELKVSPFSVLHIASHGHFGGSAGDSYLLAFDERFTMDRLARYVGLFRFRDEPLDLLTLSACETAAGDDRSALGLAGVAVRAGARSALATLWHVNDPSSYELVVEFYRQLRTPGVSRGAALRAAQMKLLDDQRYDHPGYWAPFLLINNWL